jgi:3-hydroxy-5-methyl-1-naphthoate 3-O-methyltransferase
VNASEPAHEQPGGGLFPTIVGYQPGAVIMAAADIGLLDALADGPVEAFGLASRLGVSERGLDALVGALRAIGVVEGVEAVGLTADAQPLVRTGAGGFARLLRKEHAFAHLWNELSTFVRRGTGHYASWRDRGRIDPEGTAFFLAALNDIALGAAPAVLAAADLGDARTVIDVGGGGGAFARAIVDAHPDATVAIVELPATAPLTAALVGSHDRIRLVEGDAVMSGLGAGIDGADAVFCSHVLHDLSADEAEEIVHAVAGAVRSGGVVVINDTFQPNGTDVALALFDVMMVVETPAGRCHRLDTVLRWMADAGLVDVDVRPLVFGQVLRAVRP